MIPPPTPTPESILSLPVSTAALGLSQAITVVILLVLLLARRRPRGKSVPCTFEVGHAPWLAALLDGLPQAALVVGPNGLPVTWNAAAARSLDLSKGATRLPPSLAALVIRVIESGATETTEIVAPHAPGRSLRATASLLGEVGEHGILVLVQNPAEEARGAEPYRRLIGAMAHELRTPLTAILGHADILGSCNPIEEEALWRRSRGFIASEAERLARLVEDLLTLSRLDLTPLQRRPVNLRAVAEEAISALFQVAQVRGVRLALQSPPNLSRILGDRDRLQQVFLNLLDNAIKYSSTGGEVMVRLTPQEDLMQVEVRDDGVGIAPEDLPYVFDPLYRSENVRDVPGTGLGLTIVRTILEQHGATIDVQSTPGHGTTFHFGLPCAQSEQASRPKSLHP